MCVLRLTMSIENVCDTKNTNSPNSTNIPDYALQLIHQIAREHNFTTYTVTPAAGSKHGDGFQGVMLRISINGQRNQHTDQLVVLCKIPPASETRRKQFNTNIVFNKEVYVYDRLIPEFVRFQERRGVCRPDGFFEFPKCFGTYFDATTGNSAIIMEDLRASGYKMWNKFETLDYAHASLVMQALGRFHAISFAMRDQEPTTFAEFQQMKADTVKNMLDTENSQNFMAYNFDLAIETLDTDELQLRENMQNLKESYVTKLIECTAEGAAEPFSVINHGDFWNNNMMYQYDDGDAPKTVCLIDWQIAQCCSPAMDISYFMYTSTEQSLRDNYYDELIQEYYNSLANALQKLGSDVNKLFTFCDLQDQLRQFARFSLIMAPMAIPFVVAKPQNVCNFDEMSESTEHRTDYDGFVEGNDPVYQKRMADVIKDFFFSRNYNL